MRRGFSILLILLFGLGPLYWTLEGGRDVGLPACCRRHGAHHCAMAEQRAALTAAADSAPIPSFASPRTCPLFPGFTIGPLRPAHALAATGPDLPGLLEQKRGMTTMVADASIQPFRAHTGRGPPDSEPI